QKLSILKMTPEEREEYSYYQKKLHNDRDEIAAAESRGVEKGIVKGKKEGKKEGREERNTEIARMMLEDNESIEKISKFTGLSIREVKNIKDEL
ncbi:hypothetical protein OAP56_04270, partial [Rickettsiaceae bacterium]|nr:hypothetical protein [Rickettsiaceae bacterium]